MNLYQVNPKYNAIIKEVMAYSHDNITKEIRQQSVAIKKKITELNDKIESVEERFALGEIDSDIYKKFKDKYDDQRVELQSKIENPALDSSNLEKAIEKALELSASLQYIWVNGDLKQKQKLQNLMFPGGLGYDKSNDTVRTPKVNAIFSAIHSLSGKIESIKKGEPIPVNQFSDLVTSRGFEPPTLRAEI